MDSTTELFTLAEKIQTRWATAENPHAAPGAGGQENAGRKGSPCKTNFQPGETLTMAHAEEVSGIVRRIWITINDRSPQMLRGIVLRAYWDGDDVPAVEVPLGDFFCQPLGRMTTFENAWFDNPEGRSFCCRLPMPFRKSFRLTATNESPTELAMFFYEVDFTVNDPVGPEAGYFHAHYRRENPTKLQKDFEILPKVAGRGRYLGCSIGVIADTQRYPKTWWGEGEVKIYLDGDGPWPTLCGTGTEDYISTGWGQGRYGYLWHGCPLACETSQFAFYRLHGPDPVFFHRDIRVTIQQIGWSSREQMIEILRSTDADEILGNGDGSRRMTLESLEAEGPMWLFEREDDWCATAYFYLDATRSGLPGIEPYEARAADLTGDPEPQQRGEAGDTV
jgi:hypothetical protein